MTTEQEHAAAYQAARRQVRRLRGFYIHLAVYLAVNAVLFALHLFAGRPWATGALLGWGIGVLVHGASALFGGRLRPFGAEWEARKIREIMNAK
ncbi:MAG: 2TM domain-containing protein [Zoogloeaceae bacterium]|jgi:hypothetical protein|nr:2TM domain-containing protein [Zoogloeaceae bacterium]